MSMPSLRRFLAVALIAALAGCTSAPKKSKDKTAVEPDPWTASTEKLRKDAGQTEADLADLEAQAKSKK